MLRALPAIGEVVMTAERETDQALVSRCLAGDAAALTTLVERYQSDVFGACLRVTRDAEVAIELANTVFYKAYRNLHTYEPARPLKPWLLRIATNESLNHLRGQRREREHRAETSEESEVSLIDLVPATDDPARDVLTAERAETVRAAVASLPDRYRALIVLRFFNDLSYNEIAEQLDIPTNTVGVQLMRARNLLRRALAGQEGDDEQTS